MVVGHSFSLWVPGHDQFESESRTNIKMQHVAWQLMPINFLVCHVLKMMKFACRDPEIMAIVFVHLLSRCSLVGELC